MAISAARSRRATSAARLAACALQRREVRWRRGVAGAAARERAARAAHERAGQRRRHDHQRPSACPAYSHRPRQCIGTSSPRFTAARATDVPRALYNRARGVYNPKSSIVAGWSSPVARRAHNPKVAGSNPAPATKPSGAPVRAPFLFLASTGSSGAPRARRARRRVSRPRPSGSRLLTRYQPRSPGVSHVHWQASRGRVLRHVLARLRRHRRRRARPPPLGTSGIGWSASRSPSASRSSPWPTPSATSPAATSTRPSPSGSGPAAASRPARSPSTSSRRSLGAIAASAVLYVDRQRQGRLQPLERLRRQRLRRALARRLQR